MAEANTLAYSDLSRLRIIKSIMVQVPEAVILVKCNPSASDLDRSMHRSLWV